MIELRRLFDKYRIEWREHGANTSRGNINISCPLCNKTTSQDRGYHLGILEATGQFHCFRNPKHSGRNLAVILRTLRIPDHEYEGEKFKESSPEPVEDKRVYTEFNYFESAENSQEALKYLEDRLFSDPIAAIKKYNLKYSPSGKWVGRLIIPLTIGWTGRSMRDHIQPRYLAHTNESGFFYYSNNKTSVIILEGSIDGMRAATVSNKYDVIAKCSNKLSPALLHHLRTKRYFSIYNTPDGDVPFLQYNDEMRLLRSYCTWADIVRPRLPEEFKDLGQMNESLSRKWTQEISA